MVRPISTFLPALLLLVASFGLSACDLGFDDTNPDMELPASADREFPLNRSGIPALADNV